MKIKNNLAVLMAKSKIKIAGLSRLTGVSRTTLTSLYYNRERGISYDIIMRLIEGLKCSLDELFVITN